MKVLLTQSPEYIVFSINPDPLQTCQDEVGCERFQCVKVGSAKSRWTEVISGIPQGSVLGPVLFLVFISDLAEDLEDGSSLVLKYIDDTKVMNWNYYMNGKTEIT